MFSFFRRRPAATTFTYDNWKKRIEDESPMIREKFLSAVFEDGSHVVEVGDIVWWPYKDPTEAYILGSVRLNTGRCLALGYENGTFTEPLDATGKAWAFKNCSRLPSLELDDDAIMVSITDEFYLMAMFGSEYGSLAGPRTWRYNGVGCSGDAALRKFEEHGFTVD